MPTGIEPRVYEDFAYYPEVRSPYIGRKVGDFFKRFDLSPFTNLPLYDMESLNGGAVSIIDSTYLEMNANANINGGIGINAVNTRFWNSTIDIDEVITQIQFDTIISSGNGDLALFGSGLTEASLPETTIPIAEKGYCVYYDRNSANPQTWLIFTGAGINREFHNTGVSFSDNPIIKYRVNHDVSGTVNHEIYNTLDELLYSYESPISVNLSIIESLGWYAFLRRQAGTATLGYVYGWSGILS